MKTIKRTRIADLLKSPQAGTEVNVRGWVRTRRSSKQVSGHGRHGVGITLPGTEEDIGKIIRVRVTAMKNNTLVAERID